MRYILFTLLFGGMVEQAAAQIISFAPDTLLKETFEIDPSDDMLSYPNGDDIFWVNWAQFRNILKGNIARGLCLKRTNCLYPYKLRGLAKNHIAFV
jgi:hypothetical protein